jgi:colanic acid biosynthesis protein WcaH
LGENKEMIKIMFIPSEEYKDIITKTTVLCIDVILRHKNKVLLVKRTEEPCKGVYWPVGGRVQKGETVDATARRKIKEEIGIEFKGPLIPIGYYEDTYSENSFENNTEYSTFSLVFVGDLNKEAKSKVKLDHTSDDFGYFDRLPDRFVVKRFSDFEDVLQDWK